MYLDGRAFLVVLENQRRFPQSTFRHFSLSSLALFTLMLLSFLTYS
jgi:hypothetical protein